MKRYLIKRTFTEDNTVMLSGRSYSIREEDLNKDFIAKRSFASMKGVERGIKSWEATAEHVLEVTGYEMKIEVVEVEMPIA